MTQRETVTDQLAKVIQVIQLGRKTGTLTVEHGEGSTFEEGILVFVNGQVTEANVGQRRGQDAFNWLNTWGMCRFAFHPHARESASSAAAGFSSGADPALRTPQSSDGKVTRPIPALQQQRRESVQSKKPDALSSTPHQIRAIDEALYLIENAGLSRTHRQIFLLLDGRRTVIELVRLTGRKLHDLAQILSDLERTGVIHL